ESSLVYGARAGLTGLSSRGPIIHAQPASSTHDILVEGERARMEPAGHGHASVTFHCDTETFILLMYGRVTHEAALASGRLRGEGNHQLINTFGQYFGQHR